MYYFSMLSKIEEAFSIINRVIAVHVKLIIPTNQFKTMKTLPQIILENR